MSKVVPIQRSTAPSGLSVEARRLWDSILDEYDLGDDGFGMHVLAELCRLLDEIRAVQAQVVADGRTLPGSRKGTRRPHPLLRVESEYRRLWMQYARLLNLDMTPE